MDDLILSPRPGAARRLLFDGKLWVLPLVVLMALQTGCLFGKKKATAQFPSSPIRVVLLPFDVTSENADQRWLSLALPVVAAEILEEAPDLEAVPLWESMPIAVQAAGASRTMNAETAAYIASRMAERWAIEGKLTPAKNDIAMIMDFIPAKASLVPFRYEATFVPEKLTENVREAVVQFLRYVIARPLTGAQGSLLDLNQLKEISGALDREYGWFEQAEPAAAAGVVQNLAKNHMPLARTLFNPAIYPSLEPPGGNGPRPAQDRSAQGRTAGSD